jgi:hypothetical protein
MNEEEVVEETPADEAVAGVLDQMFGPGAAEAARIPWPGKE